jgi:hypothetical protein
MTTPPSPFLYEGNKSIFRSRKEQKSGRIKRGAGNRKNSKTRPKSQTKTTPKLEMERGNKKEKESKKRFATVPHLFFLSLSICIPCLIPRHQGQEERRERWGGERERELGGWEGKGKKEINNLFSSRRRREKKIEFDKIKKMKSNFNVHFFYINVHYFYINVHN